MDPDRRWARTLGTLLGGHDLTDDDTAWVMGEVVQGSATPARLAAFLAALRAKGETSVEVRGLVRALIEHATTITVPGRIVDVVGTGGAGGLNISTMASIVV
ncbi:MAG TPA: anthranilate phosphoribosyltransferase, partial [Mycobacteriales bacterium]|nr:anthranilate phosphoribosyltransferase [Mycobacteriales bacterium]